MNRRNADNPVELQVTHIDPTILPANFSTAYRMIVLNNLSDMGRVAGKANEAADDAYQSKTRNDEQDRVLATQAQQINAVSIQASAHQSKIQTLENGLIAARQRINALEEALRSHGLID